MMTRSKHVTLAELSKSFSDELWELVFESTEWLLYYIYYVSSFEDPEKAHTPKQWLHDPMTVKAYLWNIS